MVDGTVRFSTDQPTTYIMHMGQSRIVNYVEVGNEAIDTLYLKKNELEIPGYSTERSRDKSEHNMTKDISFLTQRRGSALNQLR